MKAREILVATHGHCFDGAASAALFTRLRREVEPDAAGAPATGGGSPAFRYKSCGYGPGMQAIPEGWLDGDENAILDFRYTPSKRLSWYFDHHVTGFGSAAEGAAAIAAAAPAGYGAEPGSAGRSPIVDPGYGAEPADPGHESRVAFPQVFWEPTYGSCAKLIADVARARFGVDMSPLAELIGWADVIDTARFPSAAAATSQDEPVLQLAAVIEHHGDGPFLNALVPRLLERPLGEVALAEDVQALWAPIRASRAAFEARVERAAVVRGPVVLVDLTDAPVDVAAKFVTYARFPECTYSVMLTRNRQHFKLSIGYNPWSGVPRGHDIASICRRYDGGGHPAVGACSFPLSAAARAREAALAVTEELGR
jgi:hypothetical protein